MLCRFIWSLIVNDCVVTKEALESEEFTKGSIELRITMIEGVLTLDPMVLQKGRVLSGATGIRFETVECSEVEVIGKFKTRHIKGSAECPPELFKVVQY